MFTSQRRTIAAAAVSIVIVACALIAPRRDTVFVPPGNHAVATMTGLDYAIHATSVSPQVPVRIDAREYSAHVHFGDVIVQVRHDVILLPDGSTSYFEHGAVRSIEVRQLRNGFDIILDGVRKPAKLTLASRESKAEKLRAYDAFITRWLDADLFELKSLDPDDNGNPMGRTLVKDRNVRKKLLAVLRQSIRDHDATIALCYEPRHQIEVRIGDATHQITICFECHQAKTSNYIELDFLISDTAQPYFDQVLRDAGVPLPPPARK